MRSKIYILTLGLSIFASQLFAQTKNPADYKVSSNGFYENKGQIVDQNYNPNPAVKYLLCQPGINVQLRQTGFSYDTYTDEVTVSQPSPKGAGISSVQGKFQTPPDITRHYHRVDIELVGCNTAAPLLAEDKSEAYYNYFTAGTAKGGVSEVHHYQKVTYKNIYPNIDLVFIASLNPSKGGTMGSVEYNFVIHPGGNPANIKLQYKGANKVTLTDNKLVVNVQAGDFTENIPSSYLQNNKQQVQVNYASLGNNIYGFSVPEFPPLEGGEALIIDPTPCLTWGTYYGGSNGDFGYSVAVDGSGNAYITGTTGSGSSIATAGAYQTIFAGGSDVFVAKFNSTGSTLVWGTYYGGSGTEAGNGILVDASNNVYIIGTTTSVGGIATGFGYQTANGGSNDAFAAKFNSSGTNLIWGTFFGGSGVDYGYGIALDASNNVYITGYTQSASAIATGGAYQTTNGGGQDAFVAKLNSGGSSLLWASYYGGTGNDIGYGVGVDASSNVFITGTTTSTTAIATAGAYQTAYGGGNDAFVAKFNSSGSSLLWGTYYGGLSTDEGYGITIDASGNPYIVGYTASTTGIASAGAYQVTNGGGGDALVAKFNSTNSSLAWGTYYGGSTIESGQGIAVDATDNVYITGYTQSTTNIATGGAYQTTIGGGNDAFVAKLKFNGAFLFWGTYYGGLAADDGYGITLDAAGNVYTSGYTSSSSAIATAGAYQTSFGGSFDAYVAKFGCNPIALGATSSQTDVKCNGNCNGTATANPSGGNAPYTYSWNTLPVQTNQTATGLCAGSYTCTVTDNLSNTVTVSVTITQPPLLTVSAIVNNNVLCNGGSTGKITANPSGGTPAYTYSWSNGGTGVTISNLSTGSYTITVTDNNGCTATASASITQPPLLTVTTTVNNNVLCNGGSTGKVTSNPSGGAGAYTYSWSSGSTTAAASNLPASTYTITITDANGCTATASVIITQPGPITINATPVSPNICAGSCTDINETTSGGTPGYSFSWSTGATTTSINVCPLSLTVYTVTVTDANGCIQTNVATVNVNALPTVTLSAAQDTQCVNMTTDLLTGNPSGGTYSGPGVSGNNFDANTAGLGNQKVKYTYTDVNGCTNSDSVIINVDVCAGINGVTLLDQQIKLYPDPFSKSINVDNSTTEALIITMFNMMGQQMGIWQLDKGLNTISTETYPTGVYMLQVKTKDGILNKKLVKVN